MDILIFHKKLIHNYKTYIQSFLNIKDPGILNFVDSKIQTNALWPEPLVQFNPTFEKGRPLYQLVQDGPLHAELGNIFNGYSLYKHQEEAILLGASGKEFIVTSGTGSGKSLTYMATIFNHVLQQGKGTENKIQAVVVYPMNALINSQYNEIENFKKRYEDTFQKPFPITFGQYTGQESEEQKEKLRLNPPHILLTNYMMLELLMTRGGRDVDIRENFLKHINYLVFDELHTYRGRQGSDVSILIRRIKASAQHPIICIGTSATMVSGDNTSLSEQKNKVAEIASTIFGSDIHPSQVVNEYLTRSIGTGHHSTKEELIQAINAGILNNATEHEFEIHPTANWIEESVALEEKDGVLVRRKPTELSTIGKKLAEFTGMSVDSCINHIEQLLEWANILNSQPNKQRNFLPYRIHQFIAQTGSVYSTLGDQESRELRLDIGLYADDKESKLFPMVFSRASGHEFTCVKLDSNDSTIRVRDLFNNNNSDDDEESSINEGYIFVQHKDDEEPIWDLERDSQDFPDSWYTKPRKDGTRTLLKERENRLPKKIHFTKQGDFSFDKELEFEGWYIPYPLMLDPTSGTIFDSRTSEWTKVMKLGGEGRSTATTVLSFETITQLQEFGEDSAKQKLLSFTDNRQDASLQAGHFNDFVKVGQLRAAIASTLETNEQLDYSNIASTVIQSLGLEQEHYATTPASFPTMKRENEEIFRDFIMYRLLKDLRRSWRVVLPNLEQCALLTIGYKDLEECYAEQSYWESNTFLSSMSPEARKEFLQQILDFFRKSYALDHSLLTEDSISASTNKFKEKLKSPWNLDDNEKLDLPNHIRVEKLSRTAGQMYTESAGFRSVFGRYIRKVASENGIEIKGNNEFKEITYQLFDFMAGAGWLSKKRVRSSENQEVYAYQLKVDKILWKKGDGNTIIPDLIKNRAYRQVVIKPNEYFQGFYKTNFKAIKPIEGREHTGQINSETRKERESEFRQGKIGALFCSPTMELGIDISDLSIVHMRNVPPSPANYAQRSGRAGRSGQAALVLVYCSNFSAHDRHYFKNSTQMVAGSVTAPRMDLINEELLLSHLNASILTRKPLSVLNSSFGDVVDMQNLDTLPLKQEVIDTLTISENEKEQILNDYKKVISDTYFRREIQNKRPTWFTDDWIKLRIDDFIHSFDRSLNRWRDMYKTAQSQIRAATSIIDNRAYKDNHEQKIEANRKLNIAVQQRELLLNEPSKGRSGSKDQSEFYPYRYLAAEGFLPGYNFTRLPIRSYMIKEGSEGEYISRSRFIALNEFGPRNEIYHNGSKYRINRMILPEADLKLRSGKICPKSGYFLFDQQYNYEVDPITKETLNLDINKHVHTTLIEMTETRGNKLESITCQEEERTKKGYDIQTYFATDNDNTNNIVGIVQVDKAELLKVHYFPTCRIFKLNLKWRASRENGFSLNLKNGNWLSNKQKAKLIADDPNHNMKDVKLFTSGTANALYIQPVKALGLNGGSSGVITLMFALKRAIENYFQIESNEIGANIMGDEDAPNIFIYEASEGSLGVLSQIMDNPSVYKSIMNEAYKVCFFINGIEEEGKVEPATYDDLLSYYNQYFHEQIDRNLIRDALRTLGESTIEIQTDRTFNSYEEQYEFLQKVRDPNSSTEDTFLKHLYNNGLKLPDKAQPKIDNVYVVPDFFYSPNICIFCDGTPHDRPEVQREDANKREALRNSNYVVLSWHYADSLDEFTAARPDIFKQVKDNDNNI
jgi:ATP-dependent helicase YprA (DUF1998 family)